MTAPPAFMLYVKDLMSMEAFAAMALDERGAFITLMLHAWLEGSVPQDSARLARLLNVSSDEMERIWPGLAPTFAEHRLMPGRLVIPWLEDVRHLQMERSKERSDSGRRGAEKRWSKGRGPARKAKVVELIRPDSSAIAQPLANHGIPPPPPIAVAVADPTADTTTPGPSAEDGGGGGSNYDLETCRRFALYLHTSGQGIVNPEAFAKAIHTGGQHDYRIAAWLEPNLDFDHGHSVPAPAASPEPMTTDEWIESLSAIAELRKLPLVELVREWGFDDESVRAAVLARFGVVELPAPERPAKQDAEVAPVATDALAQ